MTDQVQINLSQLVGLELCFRQGLYGTAREELDIALGKNKRPPKTNYRERGFTTEHYDTGHGYNPTRLQQNKYQAELTAYAPPDAAILIVHLQEVDEMMSAYLKANGTLQCEEARERFYELARQAIEDSTDG